MRRVTIGLIAAILITIPMNAQWIGSVSADPGTQLRTSQSVAIGKGLPPYADTSLRLSVPDGLTVDYCAGNPTPPPGRCLHLAFGSTTAQWWGIRLDSTNDLHFDRFNSGWQDGVVFSRSGDVTLPANLNLPNTHLGLRVNRYQDTTLRLAFPAGGPDPCDDDNPLPGRCFQLAFGTGNSGNFGFGAGQYWGMRLDSNLDLHYDSFASGWHDRVKFARDGRVTIGTSPGNNAELLVVNGKITATSVIGAVYQDVAEWVPATVDMEPGTVVVLNGERTNEVMPSHGAYDTSVAGVVSAQPGVLLGVASDSKEQIATTGRVKVRVDATRSPIRVGDLLVTSDVPGTAMRSEPMEINGRRFHQPGTIIGKALEPLASGTGEILVLLSMQ